MLHCMFVILTSGIKINKIKLLVVIDSKLPFQITYLMFMVPCIIVQII